METKNKIYARVIESEDGTYTNEDGTRCTLDYGYLSDVADTKNLIEMGYELFFCIPDAEEYFKLTTIEGVKKRRIVNINIYWASIVRDTAQFGQIAIAENPEFNRLADCLFRLLDDSFIHSATVYGVERWEKILEISPAAGDTLDDRKARILTYLNIKLPYTWRVLKNLLQTVLGEDKFVLDYVNDECKLIVHTDRVSEQKLQLVRDLLGKVLPLNLVVEMYNHTIEMSWKEINKYAHCKTVADVKAVNPDYKNDVTADGEWIYPLPNLLSTVVNNVDGGLFTGANNLKILVITLPKATSVRFICLHQKGLEKFELYAPNAVGDANGIIRRVKPLTHAKVFIPKATDIQSAFQLSDTLEVVEGDFSSVTRGFVAFARSPKIREVMGEFPKLSYGSQMFDSCQLDKPSILRVLNSIPSYTSGSHPLTIGIHVDHKTDPDVQAAIENAKNKGWTLTVQWNGTPKSGVSTLDLEEIYAKVEKSEYGNYTDENGNKCVLDWGHLIKSPDGKSPSEMGYKLFFSLVEAEEYFKLTKEGIENE